MEYQWRSGTRAGVKAEVVAQEIDEIRADRPDGDCPPKALVDAARGEDSVLHPLFEWNDAIAAEEHRLTQARTFIRAIVRIDTSGPPRPVYAHVNLHNVGTYLPVEVVFTQPDLYEQALTELVKRLDSAQNAFNALKNAAEQAPNADRLAVISLAVQGLSTLREAIALLR